MILFLALKVMSHVLFWLTVPALLYARRRQKLSWTGVGVLATALSWGFVNAAIFFQHQAVQALDRCHMECTRPCMFDSTEPNLYGLCGFYHYEIFHYVGPSGLLLGSACIAIFLVPYWLMTRPTDQRIGGRIFVWLTIAVIAMQWAAMFSACVYGNIEWSCRRGHGLLSPPATIAIAATIAWLIGTRIARRRGLEPQIEE